MHGQHTLTAAACVRAGFGYYRGGIGDGILVLTSDLKDAQSYTIKCPAGSFKVRHACLMHAMLGQHDSRTLSCTPLRS
jgi:hypothetical protein